MRQRLEDLVAIGLQRVGAQIEAWAHGQRLCLAQPVFAEHGFEARHHPFRNIALDKLRCVLQRSAGKGRCLSLRQRCRSKAVAIKVRCKAFGAIPHCRNNTA